MRSGMGGVNGIVKFFVVDSPAVPPLTPASLLKQVGAVIDLNSNTMDLKKIETRTTLKALPSGLVAHKLTEFATGGWKAPTPEQTELLQVRTDVFRPVTLLGEFKPRSSKQCAGSEVVSCAQSAIGHVSLRLIISVILTCVLTIPCLLTSSPMINWLEERPISSVHLLLDSTWMPTQRWRSCVGRRGSGAWFTSPERRGRSCWTRGNKPPQESLKQNAHICRNSWSIAPTSGPQWM